MEPFDCIGGPRAFPLAGRQPGESEEPITGFLKAIGHCLALEPPFADEGSPALLDLRGRGSVDHVGIVGRNLLMQPLRYMGEQVAVLVDGAALGRYVAPEGGQRLLQSGATVDNQERWLAQAALHEIVENGTPSLAGLAAHVFHGYQNLLAVL